MFKQSCLIIYLLIITILITCFISSCSKNEKKLLDDRKFTKVLAELMIIDNLNVPDSERTYLSKAVFDSFNVDSTLFFKTRRFHENDEKYWIKIYGGVEELVRAKLDSLNEIKSYQNKPVQVKK
jgi:hypothetical protein